MQNKSSKKTYKIRITPERVLGPLDVERVTALVMKGRIQGQEPTSAEPFQNWAPFASFPELSEILLRKLEKDSSHKEQPSAEQVPPAASGTRPIVSTEATKTMAKTKTMAASSLEMEKEEDGVSFGIPTLLEIKVPEKKKEENPDLEKTQMHIVVPADATGPEDGATRILKTEVLEGALVPFDPNANKPNIVTDETDERYIAENGKRRLMSRNVAALLALSILLMTIWQLDQETEQDPRNLSPRFHRFPYIEVNFPPRLGIDADPGLSADLTEKGQKVIERETPSSYIRAIREFFYTAVGKNPGNYDARALLASSYMRLSETVPRDKRLFETVEKLLLPGPRQNMWTPEYVVARAEYYQMLNRFDQAQEILDAYLRVRPTPEVLYQKAKVAYERRELDTALNMISKAIPPEKLQPANPRHLLLYASLLDKKGQKDGALQSLKRLYKENKYYGPGLLFYADFLLRTGKPAESLKLLKTLIENPALLEGPQRADSFLVAAKTFEALAQGPKQQDFEPIQRALLFANLAYKLHYNREEVEETLFRIKSKIPQFKETYTFITQGRQRENAKQLELAENAYVAAVERNRNDPVPFLLIARLYESRGEIPEAIDRYKKALNTSSRPIDASLALARIYANRFQIEESRTMINTASQVGTKLDQINYLKGLLQLKAHRPDLAEPLFDLAIARGSRLVDLYVLMGDFETDRKNQKLAEFYYSVALRYDPFHPKAMLGLAEARFHLDSPSRAVSFLKDRLSAQPNSAAIMTNLAIIHLRSGDQLAGKNYLQNAIRSDPKYGEAFRLLGDLTKEEGNHQTDYSAKRHSYRYALASYEMYSKLAPNDPEGYKATADLYFDIRDLGAAAKNYHKVLELTPNYPDVRLRLAQISRNGGDADQAMKWLEEEIKKNPKSDAALVEKGNIFMAKAGAGTGDKALGGQIYLQSATKAFTEAARINEKNADALFGLGVVYHLQGSYDNALSLFARVIKLDPLKQDVYWQMGLIYQKQNNKAKAIQAFTNYKGVLQESDSGRRAEAIRRADEKIHELSR